MDILDNASKILGIKDTLRSDMDIGLELYNLQQTHQWVHRRVIKVESHISRRMMLQTNFIGGVTTLLISWQQAQDRFFPSRIYCQDHHTYYPVHGQVVSLTDL